ncbi:MULTISPECIES: RDD family protein [unclassified Psychrobacter]|uniref:RDD family protein n=1 Tax=unclassified Psychrobacter TaxID=196806 RepID=UPI00178787D8|nr:MULTISPECIES: RDD family protein [unclassified Psychrobacter]MBE0441094.1 RDD family protein [Psychrobacter sp. FME13]
MSKSLSKRTSKATTKSKSQRNSSTQQTSDEEPTIAKPMTRVVAILYDGMLILALLFLVGTILVVLGTLMTMNSGVDSSQAESLPTWYQNLIMTPSFVLTLVGFYGIFWRRGGQTLGMQTWRLKTVNNAGYLLTWGQSFKRILAACLMPLLFGIIGSLIGGSRQILLTSALLGFIFNYAFCFFNRRGLAVQDMLSNTITLKMPKVAHEGLWKGFKNRKKNN